MAPCHETQRSGQFPRRVHVVDIDQGGGELRAVSTYYEILGVAPTASAAELSTAYRRLLRQAHPDMGGSSAILDLVNEAYDALRDPSNGLNTTQLGAAERTRPGPAQLAIDRRHRHVRPRTPSHEPELHLPNTEVPVGRGWLRGASFPVRSSASVGH